MAFAAVAGSVMIVHSIRSIFGARPPARPVHRLLPRHVGVVARPHGALAGVPLVAEEAEGAGADRLPRLLERVGRGDPLRHDEAGELRLAERQEQPGKRCLRRTRRRRSSSASTASTRCHITWAKTSRAAHRLMEATQSAARDRLAVVEPEAGAQGEGGVAPVVLRHPAFRHLRPDLARASWAQSWS
jgi:hypothetical protein